MADSANQPTSNMPEIDQSGVHLTDQFMPDTHKRSSRFIGELDPAMTLMGEEETSPRRADRHNVGAWVENDKQDTEVSESDQTEHLDLGTFNSDGQWLLPGDTSQEALLRIFTNRVQPLLPVLEESDAIPPMLMQAICLVASKDAQAKPHLRLKDRSMSVSNFARRLYRDADTRLKLTRPSTVDRVQLVQVHLLLSLHCEGSNGAEESALHLCQAIFHAHSIGLHLVQPSGDGKSKRPLASFAQQSKGSHIPSHRYRLYWCLWSLDRLNAAINGRPRLLNSDDTGLDFQESLSLFSPTARVWMRISEILNRVIDLYSPNATARREDNLLDFLSFDELLAEKNGHQGGLSQDLVASLEMYYHAVSMTSCRLRLQAGQWRGSRQSLRRSLSVASMCSMLDHVSIDMLAPLPIVPYAISLTLLVAYQHYRQSSRSVGRAIAKDQMDQCPRRLREMGSAWWPARNMARIGQRVLQQLSYREDPPHASDPIEAESQIIIEKNPTIAGANRLGALGLSSDLHPQHAQTSSNHHAFGTECLVDQSESFADFTFDESAFADMDAVFGNLMDMNMNALPDDFDFAFGENTEESRS